MRKRRSSDSEVSRTGRRHRRSRRPLRPHLRRRHLRRLRERLHPLARYVRLRRRRRRRPRRQEAADRAAIALAEHRATKRLLFTSFESCDLETAERLRLHIPRIHLRSGVRTCDIHPSDYLQELGLR
ncbi:MAG: hypothetical protein ACLTDR_13270 [Adlercreutzia equolifaciens]